MGAWAGKGYPLHLCRPLTFCATIRGLGGRRRAERDAPLKDEFRDWGFMN